MMLAFLEDPQIWRTWRQQQKKNQSILTQEVVAYYLCAVHAHVHARADQIGCMHKLCAKMSLRAHFHDGQRTAEAELRASASMPPPCQYTYWDKEILRPLLKCAQYH
jgi:hypothetical protein